MADLDSSTPLKRIGTTALVINDGTTPTALTVSGIFEGNISFTLTDRTVVDQRSQGRHKSTPVLMETTDGVVSIELEGKLTSFKGSSNKHMYEFLTGTGTATAIATTADGDGQAFEIVLTFIEAKQSSPATQTLTFAFCVLDSLQIEATTEDAVTFKASFTDYENKPTAA